MAQRTFDFVQLDVFTRTPLAGNQLAVFTDARGLSDGEMQSLAREMNLSETTFILPRDPQTELREGVKVRIFTVEEELPFAGHPTLGTALCLRSLKAGSGYPAPDRILLDLLIGKIPVQFSEQSDGSVFAEMRQRDPEFGPLLNREDVGRAIGIDPSELSSNWPIQVVSVGLAFAVVPFRRRDVLANLKFTHAQASNYLERTSAKFFYFLCPLRDNGKLEATARMIFYNGEDPATGSAAGCAASWMIRHGVSESDEQVLIRQGTEIQRPSELYVRACREGDLITNVRVGGYGVEVLRGTVTL